MELDAVTSNVLKAIDTNGFKQEGAYNLRYNGQALCHGDSEHIKLWGKLQYFDTLKEGENGQAKAEALLKLYNSKTRKLKISNALGDVRVRAGCLIGVALDLGDIIANTLMLVEKVTHTFKESEHLMDLTLRGGEFIA